MPYQFRSKLKQYLGDDIDDVVVYSPQLTLANAGAWVIRVKKARYFLNIQDLFPQNGIDLGVLKNPLEIALFKAIEKNAYKAADVVTAHSEGYKTMFVLVNWLK